MENGMALPTMIGDIVSLGTTIAGQIAKAQVNKKQCQRLAGRIDVVITSVQAMKLPTDKKSIAHYEKAFYRLTATLTDSLALVNKYTQAGWFKRVLKAGMDQQKFQLIYDRLAEDISQLNLGLNIEQFLNRAEDKEDRKQDKALIQEKLEEIIKLNKASNDKLQKLDVADEKRHELTRQQIQSMREQILRAIADNAQAAPFEQMTYIPFYECAIDEEIGSGSLGTVYFGKWREQEVAVKQIDGLSSKKAEEAFIREVNIMRALRSPNMVALYGACLEQHPDGGFKRGAMIMEYMAKGSLEGYCKDHYPTPQQCYEWVMNIALALNYLHNEDMIHRNLSPASILLDKNRNAKLGGFGLVKTTKLSNVKTAGHRSDHWIWLAPEILERGSVTEKSDVYAFGSILYWLLTRVSPYPQGAKSKVQQPAIPVFIHETYRSIIEGCWQVVPDHRMSMSKIIRTLRQQETTLKKTIASIKIEQAIEAGDKCQSNKQYSEAVKHYKAAAKQGYSKAKTNVAFFYIQGIGGVERDGQKANELLEEAASQGHVRAMVNLWKQHEKGDGVEKDHGKIQKWLRLAAINGDKESQKKYMQLSKQHKATEQPPGIEDTPSGAKPGMRRGRP